MEGCDVLKQGLIKRISNGNSTHVWNDNWLPWDTMMRPIGPPSENKPKMVSELIDHVVMAWDEQVLEEHFLPMDAEIIRMIPLATKKFDNFWAWFWEKSEEFTVR